VESSGGVADDGRWLLHGRSQWYAADGRPTRRADYRLGRLIGVETLWGPDGRPTHEWDHGEGDGIARLTTWGPDGQVRTRSAWRGKRMVEG